MSGGLRFCRALAGVVLAGAGIAAAQVPAPDGAGQIKAPEMFEQADPALTRDLRVEIRDLSLDVRGSSGDVQDMSGQIRDMVEDSGGLIAMRETPDSIVLAVASDVLFDFDSSELTDQARDALIGIATMIPQAGDGPVQVIGHTDSKGSDDYNQRLSEQRARAVVVFLTDQDVPAERLKPLGRGESEPVADNQIDGADNPDGRAKNRRVEFVLPK